MSRLSRDFNDVDLKVNVKYNEFVINSIKFDTCMGCVYRGCCDDSKYMQPGSYCRDKQIISGVEVHHAR